ncbi:hypothetical protein T492DRAFT_850203 [Pavlovales sp. CCMP2436]|nr:hypothetical protein T492DRAFT_850203 [Pavlovales sp. CCMP2436]
MVYLAVGNTLGGLISAPGKLGYCTEIGLAPWLQQAAWAYVAVFASIVAFKHPPPPTPSHPPAHTQKISAASNAMLDQPWWTQTPSFMVVAGLMDRGFLFCAAVVPMLFAGYMLAYKGAHIAVINVEVDVRNRASVRPRKTFVSKRYLGEQGKFMTRAPLGYSYIEFNIEVVHLVGYSGFWLVVISGIAITHATKG